MASWGEGAASPFPFVCPAGGVVVMHYDLWHRAFQATADGTQRIMIKFHCWRTEAPVRGGGEEGSEREYRVGGGGADLCVEAAGGVAGAVRGGSRALPPPWPLVDATQPTLAMMASDPALAFLFSSSDELCGEGGANGGGRPAAVGGRGGRGGRRRGRGGGRRSSSKAEKGLERGRGEGGRRQEEQEEHTTEEDEDEEEARERLPVEVCRRLAASLQSTQRG